MFDLDKIKKAKEAYPTFAYSIVENRISGKIHMDDSNQSALIGTESGIFVVVGDPTNNGIQSLLLEIHESRKKGTTFTVRLPIHPKI